MVVVVVVVLCLAVLLAGGGFNGKQAQLLVRGRAFGVWRLRCPGKVVQQGLKAQVPVSACLSPSPNRGDNRVLMPQASRHPSLSHAVKGVCHMIKSTSIIQYFVTPGYHVLIHGMSAHHIV